MNKEYDPEYEVAPARPAATDSTSVLGLLGLLLITPLLTAAWSVPLAPFVWLLMVAVGFAPMSWTGLFANWLILTGIFTSYIWVAGLLSLVRQCWAAPDCPTK